MKLVVSGKGGSGKTVLVSLLARALSERGHMVLALDLDPSPGLAVSLGVPALDLPLPEEVVERRPSAAYGWGLAEHLSPAEAVRRYAVPAGERIRYLGFGSRASVRTPVSRYMTAVQDIAHGFDEPGWVVVADLAAGPTTAFAGDARFATLALLAAEDDPVSKLTAERLTALMEGDGIPARVVVTKATADNHGNGAIAIPFDPEIRRLERHGSLRLLGPDSPALNATRSLVADLGL